MGFERNDVVFKNRLNEALNEENNMGFEHNDIVTVDTMNKAIAEGGGGGDYTVVAVSMTGTVGSFFLDCVQDENSMYTSVFELNGAYTNSANTDGGVTTVYNLIFSGDSVVVFPGNVVSEVTGDAVYDSGTGLITVTGDFAVSGFYDD